MICHVIVDIKRNEGATIRNSFPLWELPILTVVHGDINVTVVGERLIDRALPDPHDEFTRLLNRYKRSRDESGAQSTPYINMVYGEMGIQRLADAMQAALAEAPEGDLVGGEPNSSVGG